MKSFLDRVYMQIILTTLISCKVWTLLKVKTDTHRVNWITELYSSNYFEMWRTEYNCFEKSWFIFGHNFVLNNLCSDFYDDLDCDTSLSIMIKLFYYIHHSWPKYKLRCMPLSDKKRLKKLMWLFWECKPILNGLSQSYTLIFFHLKS